MVGRRRAAAPRGQTPLIEAGRCGVAESEMATRAEPNRDARARCAVAALSLLLAAYGLGCHAAAQTTAPETVPAPIAAVAPAAPAADPDGCAAPDPAREAQFLEFRVLAPRKEAWQDALGGQLAAKPRVKERLAGWPTTLLADRSALPADDDAFLRRLARDTWLGIAALTDRVHGVPVDHVRFCGGSLAPEQVKIGDYTSGTNIGMHLLAIVGAFDMELIPRAEAVARVRRVIESLKGLETFGGFFFNYYDTTTLERTTNFVSFVDSAWLTTGLIVARQAFSEVWDDCTSFIDHQDYGFFYDTRARLMLHGFTVKPTGAERSRYHYGTLYTEARLGSIVAIAKGQAPESLWFEMRRTLPPSVDWQKQTPRDWREKEIRGHRFYSGLYEWRGHRYVPSWGGSMFEALMPALALDERALAPRSLGRNDDVHAEVQRRFATEELGWPVWGMSPSAQPNSVDYGEFGVPALGLAGYKPTIVTPHASALALVVAPGEATANLRRLADRYDLYGEFGLYDAVDPATGTVAHAYLSLDQSMSFVALVNHLRDGSIQKRFAADPAVAPALSLIGEEDFFE
jgi:hypothetical protein